MLPTRSLPSEAALACSRRRQVTPRRAIEARIVTMLGFIIVPLPAPSRAIRLRPSPLLGRVAGRDCYLPAPSEPDVKSSRPPPSCPVGTFPTAPPRTARESFDLKQL